MSKYIEIGNRFVGDGAPAYIIAEMACAHDGSVEKAKKLVDAAVAAKPDAVQLQFFSVEDLMTPDHESYEVLKRIEFTPQQWEQVFKYAKRSAIDVFACTYDIQSVNLAIRLGVDGIKLNSSDLSNPDMIKAVAGSKIPYTLGTGASTMEEIAQAIDLSMGAMGDKIVLMHGVQNFPTDIDNANINRIKILKSVFQFPIGYADHTNASDEFSRVVDLLALGSGACLLEKHITIDRSEKGVDHEAALEPLEFKKFVNMIRISEKALGESKINPLSDSDKKYRKFQKKSIVTSFSVKKGQKLERSHLAFKRSKEIGIPPAMIDEIIGNLVNRNLEKNKVVKTEYLTKYPCS